MQQHIVKKGDTVARIAAAAGLTPEHIVQGNPWAASQPYLIPGQILYLPSPPRRRCSLQQGDHAELLAQRFSVSVEDLEQLNPGLLAGRLKPGTVIVLPPPKKEKRVLLRGEYGPAELAADAAALKEAFPFIEVRSIGASVMGKPITLLKLGEGPRYLHVNAALHANEWMTSACLMSFIEQYASAVAQDTEWLGSRPADWYRNWTLLAVPMANPDGVELVQEGVQADHPLYAELSRWNGGRTGYRHWKANIRGVDLGDQFPAFWEEERQRRGALGPGPRDYGGEAPLSEPEAAALVRLAEEYPGDAAVSLHSQGQEIYWNYRGYEPPDSERLAQKLAAAAPGYRTVYLEGSDAGYKDWFILHTRKPAFTIELGWGRNPLPASEFEDMALETGRMLAELLQYETSE